LSVLALFATLIYLYSLEHVLIDLALNHEYEFMHFPSILVDYFCVSID